MMTYEVIPGIAGGAVAAMIWFLLKVNRTLPSHDWMDDVRRLLERGDKLAAVRIYQDRTGCSADDARRDVDAMTY